MSGTPVFAETGYRFALSENAEGSVNRQSLGTVTATDPDGDGTVRYRLDRRERVAAASPSTRDERVKLFYVGPGEDYESRVTSHELTVRASDGAYSDDRCRSRSPSPTRRSRRRSQRRATRSRWRRTSDGSDERLVAGDGDGDGPRR